MTLSKEIIFLHGGNVSFLVGVGSSKIDFGVRVENRDVGVAKSGVAVYCIESHNLTRPPKFGNPLVMIFKC